MNTKQRLLALLESDRGVYLSGEQLAEQLEVSRNSVWKAVNALRKDGYCIDAVSNKGYSLSAETDILSCQGIGHYLHPGSDLQLTVLPTVSSTNAVLRQQAAAGAPEGTVIAAAAQTEGRGRFGRDFFSPADTGVYLSLLLRPDNLLPTQAVCMTTMAAVAAAEAIEAVSGRPVGIKWVNDLYMEGRKVSGILTEASVSLETGTLDYLVLGIGINVYEPEGGFPDELKDLAGAVFGQRQSDSKNRLAAEFLNRFSALYREGPASGYAQNYRERSLVIGRPITVLSKDGPRSALALDVDEDCRLYVRYDSGEEEHLSSGEISIRL